MSFKKQFRVHLIMQILAIQFYNLIEFNACINSKAPNSRMSKCCWSDIDFGVI